MLHKEGGSKPIDFSIKMPKIKTTREWKNFSRRAELKVSQDIRRAVLLGLLANEKKGKCSFFLLRFGFLVAGVADAKRGDIYRHKRPKV